MRKTDLERFTEKVQINTGCWIWTGCILKNGYGQGYWDGKKNYAHRISYQIYKGEIPAGLVIDHLCRVRACVNPDHLEVVTNAVNIQRGLKSSVHGYRSNQTHCKNGHEFNPENTRMRQKGKCLTRICQPCVVARNKKHYAKIKLALL